MCGGRRYKKIPSHVPGLPPIKPKSGDPLTVGGVVTSMLMQKSVGHWSEVIVATWRETVVMGVEPNTKAASRAAVVGAAVVGAAVAALQ
jgi:hypothetical protein